MIRRWLAALLAMGCRSVRIAGNVVDQVRLVEGDPYLAVGIASNLGFDRLDVLDNSVVPGPGKADPAGGGQSTDLDVSIGLLISEVPGEDQLFIVDEKLYLVAASHVIQLSPSRPRLVTAVRGNRLDAAGDGPTAIVSTKGSCTFAENHCTLVSPAPAGAAPGVAIGLAVDTLVLSGNQVVGPRNDAAIAVDANVAGGTITGAPAITALGNITAGRIVVNGGPLQAPWAPLNVRTS